MPARREPAPHAHRGAAPALTVTIALPPLVEIVRRHVKVSPHAARLIEADFAQLLQTPVVLSHTGPNSSGAQDAPAQDPVLSTQAAADLVGVSRPYLVARIDAGDIPLHHQVGNQRRVLQSDVLAWHQQMRRTRRTALDQLGTVLDDEIFQE